MRRIPPLVVLLTVAAGSITVGSPSASAHPWRARDVGIGVSLGQPTALTLEFRPNHWSGFDLAFGFGVFDFDDEGDGDRFDDAYVHLVYLVKPFRLTHSHGLSVPFYLGVGGFISDHGRDFDGDNLDLGGRFPVGIAFEFEAPVELFLELAVRFFAISVDHDHGDDIDVSGALGFRIYF